MMKHLTFFLFLVLMPFAQGFDCSSLDSSVYLDCVYLDIVDESLIGNLIYTDTFYPNHQFIREYNADISVVKPDDTSLKSNGVIRNAWMSLLRVHPSVMNDGTLHVDSFFTVYSDYSYSTSVPPTTYYNKKKRNYPCRTTYSLSSLTTDMRYQVGNLNPAGKVASFSISSPVTIYANVNIRATLRHTEYEWQKRKGKLKCRYDRTTYSYSHVHIQDSVDVVPYLKNKSSFVIQHSYYDSLQGEIITGGNNVELFLDNGSYLEQNMLFSAHLTKPPNNFLQLQVENVSISELDRINKRDSDIVAIQSDTCSLFYADFFDYDKRMCVDNSSELELEQFEKKEFDASWRLLLLLFVIGLVSYFVYRLLKATWGKYIPILILPLLLATPVFASECGLTNLGACLPESLFDFFNDLINSPIQPMIDATRFLMEESVVIDPFFGIWQIILYIMGFFYLLMFTFVGFSFLTSGHDVIKREQSKEWLKNTFLVIIFTSASFYLYQLVLDLSAVLTSAFLTTVPEEFFLLTIDNITNVALQFFSSLSYVIVLGITILALGLRYIISAIGVLFIPIGLFCYFIPPLRSYGDFILQLLGISAFLPVLNALVIIACSKLLAVGVFAHVKILVMICCFLIIDALMLLAIWHIITKSGLANAGQKIVSAGKYIAALL